MLRPNHNGKEELKARALSSARGQAGRRKEPILWPQEAMQVPSVAPGDSPNTAAGFYRVLRWHADLLSLRSLLIPSSTKTEAPALSPQARAQARRLEPLKRPHSGWTSFAHKCHTNRTLHLT